MPPIDQWQHYLANNGEIVAILAGLVGAAIVHFCRVTVRDQQRHPAIAALAGFGAVFFALRSTSIGQRGDSRMRNARDVLAGGVPRPRR